MLKFVSTLSKLLVTPGKPEAGYLRNWRFQLDAHDPIDAQQLLDLVGGDVIITVEPAPIELTPIEEYLRTTSNGH